jgi:predicted nucleic acid-binding protein
MSWLIDANVPLRALHRPDPFHPAAWGAVRIFRQRGEVLCYTLQTLTEFWAVCTRPAAARGGFGLTVVEADRRVKVIERHLAFLPDTQDVRVHWRRLVVAHAVEGVRAHDARLIASMVAHGITHLLAFNVADFRRYAQVTAVHATGCRRRNRVGIRAGGDRAC